MTRPLRINLAGGWYHLTSRGVEGRGIFEDDRDREQFLGYLVRWSERFHIRIYAYVLMSNHYHLMAETLERNLSPAMQWLNGNYSMWFNRRHSRQGHLLQGRFKGIVVDAERWGLELSRYVHLNPVRIQKMELSKKQQQRNRGRVGKAVEPELYRERLGCLRGYRWSSYRAYVGLEKTPDWLTTGTIMKWVERAGERAERLYRKYVEEPLKVGLEPSPWQQLKAQMILGEDEFRKQLEKQAKGDAREQRQLKAIPMRPSLEKVMEAIEQVRKEKWESIRNRHGDWARDLVLYIGRERCGLRLRELGEAVGIDYATVGMAVRRLQQRMEHDPEIQKALQSILCLLKC